MRTVDECRIVGFTITEVDIKIGGAGGHTIKTNHVFQDREGSVHARGDFVGPWSQATLASIEELIKNMEDDLASIHFGVEGENDRPASTTAAQPQGILGHGLRGPGDQTPQL